MSQENRTIRDKITSMATWTKEHAGKTVAIGTIGVLGATGIAACGGPSQAGADHAPTTIGAAKTPGATETAPATTTTPEATTAPTTPETGSLGVDVMQSKAFLDLTPQDQAEVQKALDPNLSPENYSNQDQGKRAMIGNVIMEAYGGPFVKATGAYVIDGRTLGHNYVPLQAAYVNTAKATWDFALNTKAADMTNDTAGAAYLYYKLGSAEAYYIAANGGPVDIAKKLAASLNQNPFSTANTTHGNLASVFQELDSVASAKSDPQAISRYPNNFFAGQDVSTKAVWITGQLNAPDDTGNLSYSLNQFTYKTADGATHQAWGLRESDSNTDPLVTVQQ